MRARSPLAGRQVMSRSPIRLGCGAMLAVLAACGDHSPTAPACDPAIQARGGYVSTAFRCSVTVASRATRCAEVRRVGARGDLVLGGGNVQLNSRNVSYDG